MFTQAKLKKLLNELLKNAPQDNLDVLKIKHLADGLLNISEKLTPEQVKVLAVIFLNGDNTASFFQKLEEALQISSKTINALHKKHGFFDDILRAAKMIWVLGDEDWVRKIENEYDLNGAKATENLLEDTTFTDGITNKINIFYEAFNKKKIPTQEIINRVKSAQYNIDFCLTIINKENIAVLEDFLKKILYPKKDNQYIREIALDEIWINASSLKNYFMRLNSLSHNKKEIMTLLNKKFEGISIAEKHFVTQEMKEALLVVYKIYKTAEFTDMVYRSSMIFRPQPIIELGMDGIKKIYKHLFLEQLKEPIHDSILNIIIDNVLKENVSFIIGHYTEIDCKRLTSAINEIVSYSKKIKDNNPQYYEDIMKVAEGQALEVIDTYSKKDLKNIIQVYSSWAKYRDDGKQWLDMPKGYYSGRGYYYQGNEKEYYSVGNLGVIVIKFSFDYKDNVTNLCVDLLVENKNGSVLFDKNKIKMPEIENRIIALTEIKASTLIKLMDDKFLDEQNLVYRICQGFNTAKQMQKVDQRTYYVLSRLAGFAQDKDLKTAIEMFNCVITNSNDSELIMQCKNKLLAIVNSQKIENLEIETIACLFERLPSGSNGFEMILLVHKTNEDFYKKLWIFKNVITICPNASFSGKIHEELFNLYNVIRYDEDSKEKAQIENQCILHLIKSKNKGLIETVLSDYAGFNESQQRALTDLVDGEVEVLLREIETTFSEEKTVSPFSSNQCFYPRHLKKEDNKNSVTDEEFSPISILH